MAHEKEAYTQEELDKAMMAAKKLLGLPEELELTENTVFVDADELRDLMR